MNLRTKLQKIKDGQYIVYSRAMIAVRALIWSKLPPIYAAIVCRLVTHKYSNFDTLGPAQSKALCTTAGRSVAADVMESLCMDKAFLSF